MALNYFSYNFIKIHRTLRVSPAMAAGVTDRLWSVEDLVSLWETYVQRRANHARYRARVEEGDELLPVTYGDNYVTLFPHESMTLPARYSEPGEPGAPVLVRVEGQQNLARQVVRIGKPGAAASLNRLRKKAAR